LSTDTAFDTYDIEHSLEHRFEIAANEGLCIVVPNDRTLQLDFDSDESYEWLWLSKNLSNLHVHFDVAKIVTTVSKSGNKHVHITLNQSLDTPTRIALQAVLGSDPVREFLNIARHLKGIKDPVVFFEKPDAQPIVKFAAPPASMEHL
jgi:hypothetical protein